MKTSKLRWVRQTIVSCVIAAMAIALFPFAGLKTVTKAETGDTPEHAKTLTDNEDGTFKLELSVTGDAETKVQTAANVNVIIVYDVSQSMTTNVTGTNRSRADNAEDVVHDFIENLRKYQKADDPATAADESANIQVALVTFGPNANQRSGWTSDLTSGSNGVNRFFDDGVDGTTDPARVFNYSNNLGTNWEHGLRLAQTLLANADGDPTFVILFTDGVCTKSGTGGGNGDSPSNVNWTNYRGYYDDTTDEALAIQNYDTVHHTSDSTVSGYKNNTTLFGIYAYGTEHDLLDDLIYYSNEGSHRSDGTYNVMNVPTNQYAQHNFGATQETDNYFNAGDTTALNSAIESIFQTIVQALGVTQAAISDGTTHDVETSSGTLDLLEVDEDSYQYWLSVPVVNNRYERIKATGEGAGTTITYTVADNGDGTCTVTWNEGSTSRTATVNGSVSGNQFKYEWIAEDADCKALYNYDPPKAELNGSSVDWSLSSVGTLLDGVTYSVTFDVYPSQTTLDYIADIKNGQYDSLPAGAKEFIHEDTSFETNTSATLSWVDTRPGGGSGSDGFDNPEPVESMAVEQLAVTKEWENALDGQQAEPITLTVTRDGDPKYTLTLGNKDPQTQQPVWTDSVYISIGILRHATNGQSTDSAGNKYDVLEKGHDFTFEEPSDLGYYWELEVPTVRPMLIDGTLTMLIKKEGKYNNPSNTTEYTIEGHTYYVGDTGTASLTATNHRRARLNLTKVVDGDDADPAQTFQFTLNVVDSKASEGREDNLNSDYYVWFSVYNGGYVDALVSGATKEMKDGAWTGYYYAPSGTDIVVNLKAGDNLRFLNLPSDSTYTFTEGTLPANFTFVKSDLTAGTDSTFSGNQKTTGKIESTNTDYAVRYTNAYGLTNVDITKVWSDANNQDGKRLTADEFKAKLTLKANGTDVTSANASKLDVTDNGDNTYTVKWTGLDRYAEGSEITYTVEEATITDYTTTGSPAEDGGTITNTHTPEKTEATVKKVWDDANNQDGKRPTSVSVQLYADGTAVDGKVVTLNAGNSWTAKVEDLPKYANGTAISYTWTETVPDGYTVSSNTTEGTVTTITNKHTPELTEATVTKEWDDANNQDGKRPASIIVTLSNGTDVTLNADNNWTGKVDNLPKYANGTEITYTWTETNVPNGYSVSYNNGENQFAPNGGTITNTHTPELTEATVKKVWNDAEDQDAKRPETLTVKLMNGTAEVGSVILSDDNEWTGTVSNIPKYANGTEIQYAWVEDTLPTGYVLNGTAVDGTVTTLTNSYTPATTEATVKKVWSDANNQDGLRPESLTLQLNADGTPVEGKTVTLNAGNNWEAKIEGLALNNHGTAIVYTWTETDLPQGYTLTDTSVNGTVTTLTNSHTPEKIKIAVKKVWDDSDDKYGTRPATLAVTLHNGTEGEEKTYNLSQSNDWTMTLEVSKYAGGNEITYSWTEDTIPTGYEQSDPEVATVDGVVTTTLTNSIKYGDLIIEKDLTEFQHFEGQDRFVTIVFRVQAKLNGNKVFDKYIPITMQGASTKTIEIRGQIPVGAGVEVTEEYSGAGYSQVTANPQTTTITDPDDKETATAQVTFENTYTDQRNGYGIVNQYSHDGTGWNVEQIDPTQNSSDDPGTEPADK